jgi:hypothetical protein
MHPISYGIDSGDTIRSVGGYFDHFAELNGAPGLAGRVLGTPIWDWVSGSGAVALQHALLGRARRADAPLELRFRCDSPAERRLLRMTIVSGADGGLEFRCTAEALESRAIPALLDPHAARGDELITLCAWCNRFAAGGAWVEAEDALDDASLGLDGRLPRVTHGACPRCAELVAGD